MENAKRQLQQQSTDLLKVKTTISRNKKQTLDTRNHQQVHNSVKIPPESLEDCTVALSLCLIILLHNQVKPCLNSPKDEVRTTPPVSLHESLSSGDDVITNVLRGPSEHLHSARASHDIVACCNVRAIPSPVNFDLSFNSFTVKTPPLVKRLSM